ncbi:hypothetical protein [Streptomyces sp. NPDC046976]
MTAVASPDKSGQCEKLRSEYVHSAKDDTNLTTWSGWLYFTVRT